MLNKKEIPNLGRVLVVVTLVACSASAFAQPDALGATSLDVDPKDLKAAVDAARAFADLGQNVDDMTYINRFEKSLLLGLREPVGVDRQLRAPGLLPQPLTPEQSEARMQELEKSPDFIFVDETYQKNYRDMIENGPGDLVPRRIVGGGPTIPGEFPDCVAVGSANYWCCTGTLISPNMVIVAGHCYEGCAERVFVGLNTRKEKEGEVIAVAKAIRHPEFAEPSADLIAHDLTLLILERSIKGVTPRAIASPSLTDAATYCRLVGFGATDKFASSYTYGIQRKADTAIVSADCSAIAAGRYGCNPGLEIVAGGNGVDSCNGDSGGPLFVRDASGAWLLAGATSRATKEWRLNGFPCGMGGNYVRIDKYLPWIDEVAKENGGIWGDK